MAARSAPLHSAFSAELLVGHDLLSVGIEGFPDVEDDGPEAPPNEHLRDCDTRVTGTDDADGSHRRASLRILDAALTFLIGQAGTPPTTNSAGTSRDTTAPAATTAFLPTVTQVTG